MTQDRQMNADLAQRYPSPSSSSFLLSAPVTAYHSATSPMKPGLDLAASSTSSTWTDDDGSHLSEAERKATATASDTTNKQSVAIVPPNAVVAKAATPLAMLPTAASSLSPPPPLPLTRTPSAIKTGSSMWQVPTTPKPYQSSPQLRHVSSPSSPSRPRSMTVEEPKSPQKDFFFSAFASRAHDPRAVSNVPTLASSPGPSGRRSRSNSTEEQKEQETTGPPDFPLSGEMTVPAPRVSPRARKAMFPTLPVSTHPAMPMDMDGGNYTRRERSVLHPLSPQKSPHSGPLSTATTVRGHYGASVFDNVEAQKTSGSSHPQSWK